MKIIEEIKKGVYAHYQTLTLWTVDAVTFYMDHVPNAVEYPFIVFYHLASNNSYSMVDGTHPKGYDYVDSIFQFSLFGNDRQHSELENYADQIEDGFHKVHLILGGNVTHIATLTTDSRTSFYDQGLKVWQINQKYRIMAGK